MLIIIISIIVLFIVLPIIVGVIGCDDWEIAAELVNPKFNSFEIGITNRAYVWDNGDKEQELRIGFFIITVSCSFFKNNA